MLVFLDLGFYRFLVLRLGIVVSFVKLLSFLGGILEFLVIFLLIRSWIYIVERDFL